MIKEKVIIDCDPGIDDSLALMYALKHPDLEIVAITIVSGNAPAIICARNAAIILKKLNMNIPIYIGEKSPLVKEFVSAQDTHGEDGLGETFFYCNNEFSYQPIDATTFLSDYFNSKKDTSIIALGPLTNISKALELNPNLGKNCKRFVSMGGNYKSHGNCSPVAEFNYWCDPHAAKNTFEKLSNTIEMIGLDVTRKIVLTPNIMNLLHRLNDDLSSFIQKIINFYWDFHWKQEKIIGCVINDPLAIAHFINDEICKGFYSYVDVETDGICEGQTVVDKYNFYGKKSNAVIYTKVDILKFFIEFISTVYDIDKQNVKNLLLGLKDFEVINEQEY